MGKWTVAKSGSSLGGFMLFMAHVGVFIVQTAGVDLILFLRRRHFESDADVYTIISTRWVSRDEIQKKKELISLHEGRYQRQVDVRDD